MVYSRLYGKHKAVICSPSREASGSIYSWHKAKQEQENHMVRAGASGWVSYMVLNSRSHNSLNIIRIAPSHEGSNPVTQTPPTRPHFQHWGLHFNVWENKYPNHITQILHFSWLGEIYRVLLSLSDYKILWLYGFQILWLWNPKVKGPSVFNITLALILTCSDSMVIRF